MPQNQKCEVESSVSHLIKYGIKRPCDHDMLWKNELRGEDSGHANFDQKKIWFKKKTLIADLVVEMCGAKIFLKIHQNELKFCV